MPAPEAYILSESDRGLLQRYGWEFRDVEQHGSDPVNGDSLPPITIGILCHNRCDDVLRTLHVVVHACPYPDKEIIVVDNASSDRTVQRIHELFPDVIVIALKENTGTAGRNAFIRAARGRYLFCLDDDSLPGHAQHFRLITEWMERHPEVSLLSTRCLQPRTGVDETKDFALLGREWSGERVYEGHYAFECACCMRTDDIRAVGGYAAHDTWGAEGMELAMKLHMNGFRTVWHPGFTTLHFKQWKNRPAQSGSIGAVHHRIAFFASYLPWAVLLPLLAAYTLRRVIEGILHPSRLPGLAHGYLRGIASIPASRHHRPKLTLRTALALGRWYIGVLRW